MTKVIYNRISKAGSTTMTALILALSKINDFTVVKDAHYFPSNHQLRPKLIDLPEDSIYINHCNYVSDLPGEFVWINMMREPVERAASEFYYEVSETRGEHGLDDLHTREKDIPCGCPYDEFDECFRKRNIMKKCKDRMVFKSTQRAFFSEPRDVVLKTNATAANEYYRKGNSGANKGSDAGTGKRDGGVGGKKRRDRQGGGARLQAEPSDNTVSDKAGDAHAGVDADSRRSLRDKQSRGGTRSDKAGEKKPRDPRTVLLAHQSLPGWTADLAFQRIRDQYLFVGLTEEFELSVRMLEKLLPRFFANATAVYNKMSPKKSHANTTPLQNPVTHTTMNGAISTYVRDILTEYNAEEVGLYEKTKRLFWYKVGQILPNEIGYGTHKG